MASLHATKISISGFNSVKKKIKFKNSIFLITQEEGVTRFFEDWIKVRDAVSSEKDGENDTRIKQEVNKGLTCHSCGLFFMSRDEQSLHFKEELHRINVKRSMQQKERLSFEDFQELKVLQSAELIEEGALDSTAFSDIEDDSDEENLPSLSDTESTDLIKQGSTVIFLHERTQITVCSALLPQNKKDHMTEEQLVSSFLSTIYSIAILGHQQLWGILLLQSGRFAGVIFEGQNILVHKCFKRYTTRRKAGGAQNSADGKKKIRSVGSQLRRYGEKQLEEEVTALIHAWSSFLEACQFIFYACSKSLLSLLFTGIDRNDYRVRSIPFITQRPTLEEAKRIHTQLAYLIIEEVDETQEKEQNIVMLLQEVSISDSNDALGSENGLVQTATKQPDLISESEDVELLSLQEVSVAPTFEKTLSEEISTLLGLCSSESLCESLHQLLVETGLTPLWSEDEELIDSTAEDESIVDAASFLGPWGPNGASPLHVATLNDCVNSVVLLLRFGANPASLDWQDRPAYFLCKSKEARDAFRRARALLPERWDWKAAGVPEPLTDEVILKRKEKEREKRKRQKQKKKQEKDSAADDSSACDNKQDKIEGQQLLQNESCNFCKLVLVGVKPIIQNTQKYCSSKCFNAQKRRLIAEAAEKRSLATKQK